LNKEPQQKQKYQVGLTKLCSLVSQLKSITNNPKASQLVNNITTKLINFASYKKQMINLAKITTRNIPNLVFKAPSAIDNIHLYQAQVLNSAVLKPNEPDYPSGNTLTRLALFFTVMLKQLQIKQPIFIKKEHILTSITALSNRLWDI
jgi:hypothetical protein